MGDVNLEIKLSNLDERVIKIEESGGGSGGDGYITSVSNDFNVVNKKLSLSNNVTTKLSKVDNKIDKPTSATEGQVLTYRNNEWVADDSQGGGGQFVIIAKGEDYEGQTVTATKGTKSKSAVITSGVARITVDEGGVWTLTLSSGETFNTPNMTYYGEYEVALIPKGSTVTPTDDIQTWLKCAELNKSYTTISEVLADTNTLSALISDNNASDYLARSTTWASDVCSNESSMNYIGLNDYCANKLLDDSTWSEAICNAKDSSGNDLFEKVLNVKVPTMTSNTTPSGEAIVSHSYNDIVYPPYYAFDGNASTVASFGLNNSISWLGYYFPSKVRVNRIGLKNHINGEDRIIKFILQAFDGNDWINISDNINNPTGNTLNYFNVSNSIYYNKYRIRVVEAVNAEFWTNVAELQFYGREEA